jgi:hypothetical protein
VLRTAAVKAATAAAAVDANGAETKISRRYAAAAEAAEAVVWRRATAAAVLQRRLGRSRTELAVAHKGLAGLQGVFDREHTEWSASNAALKVGPDIDH